MTKQVTFKDKLGDEISVEIEQTDTKKDPLVTIRGVAGAVDQIGLESLLYTLDQMRKEFGL